MLGQPTRAWPQIVKQYNMNSQYIPNNETDLQVPEPMLLNNRQYTNKGQGYTSAQVGYPFTTQTVNQTQTWTNYLGLAQRVRVGEREVSENKRASTLTACARPG